MPTSNKDILLTSTICRSENSLAAEIDNELVLMSVENGNYYGLDSIGTDIWQRLEAPQQVSTLCEALSKEYEADNDTIQRDVLELLKKLSAENLINISA